MPILPFRKKLQAMSSFDKVVKLACKPKAAVPKAKVAISTICNGMPLTLFPQYLDTIIAATWSDDGAIHDVVFKALIVLHTMIRNGATDNVLGYLSNSDVLRLRNVSAGSWEGYAVPENLQNYATYLDSRIRAYRDLKHDAIRVQAENNRDMRNSASIGEDMVTRGSKKGKGPFSKSTPSATSAGPTRSKTIAGRKLRVMTVEKGLLRETKAVHRMIDSLVECRFYLDNLEDELTIAALQILVKDLLILFQAGNEGVINVLEHYFEMSHVDATEALSIYRNFCKQTERVVEFLGVAKKLQNLLNVPIPNLKHVSITTYASTPRNSSALKAPVSLAGALQEYLEDPAFEQNRIEYKATKEAADKGLKAPAKPKQADTLAASKDASAPPLPNPTSLDTSTSASKPKPVPSSSIDFFAAINEEQPTMFNPQTNSPGTAYFQAQNISNPFARMHITGRSLAQAHPTGFINFQPTATQTNPFSLQQPQSGHPAFSFFLPQSTQSQLTGFALPQQPQPTGFSPAQQLQSTNFAPLQPTGLSSPPTGLPPQPTGLPPQPTGLPPQPTGLPPQPTGLPPQPTGLPPQPTGFLQPQATGANPFRQSMMFPQTTGMQLFGRAGVPGQATQNPFPNQNQNQATSAQGLVPSQSFTSTGLAFSTTSAIALPFAQTSPSGQPANVPTRPSSTPLTSFGSAANSANSPPDAQPVKTHQTGTKNPFGPITPAAPPPVPKQPTLLELSMGLGLQNGTQQPQQQATQPQPQHHHHQQNSLQSGFNAFSSGALGPGATDISSVASSFAFSNKPNGTGNQPSASSAQPTGALNAQPTAASTISSAFSDSLWSSPLSSQPTGTTNTSASSVAPIKPQITGFAGLKPFKPTSSFGASLMESLPTIPDSSSVTPEPTTNSPGAAPSASGIPSIGGFSSSTLSTKPFMSTQMTASVGTFGSGSTLGQGLRTQMTGGGTANPFRASMIGLPNGAASSSIPPVPRLPTSALGSQSFGSNLFSGTGASGFNSTTGRNPQHQQNSASLI
ncbi:hypothetical protein C0995_012027 [Termitomyces sp. Mi166|nr:hypothetical protein C0995_012027 [Termitomyces sp. Mi166\